MHDCDHHAHDTEISSEKSDSESSDSELSFDTEDCFTCEFDLGFYSVPSSFYAQHEIEPKVPFIESKIDVVQASLYNSSLLRGPPAC